jgi:hypothetical protein
VQNYGILAKLSIKGFRPKLTCTSWLKKTKLFLPNSRKSILGGIEHRTGLKNKVESVT